MFYKPRIVLGTAREGHGAIGGGFKLRNFVLLRPRTRRKSLHICHRNRRAAGRAGGFSGRWGFCGGRSFRRLGSCRRSLRGGRGGRATRSEGDRENSEQHDQRIKSFLGHL